jgi:hypothetical protein
MPGSDVAGVHRDQYLTNLARQYRPDLTKFIADLVCPRVPVAHESDIYPVFSARDFFATDVPQLVADRSPAREIDTSYSSAPYQCYEYALKASISRRERKNADSIVRLEQRKVEAVADQLMLGREIRAAALLRKTTNGGGLNLGAGVSNKWNVDAATIETDIKVGKQAIKTAIGLTANTIVIPQIVATEVAVQQDIRDLVKIAMTGVGVQNILELGDLILPKKLWGLNVVVPDAQQITSAEGATDVYADIWGDNVRILYVDPTPDENTPSVAHSFVAEGKRVDRWTVNDPPGLEYFREGEIISETITAPDAGYEITDVL